MKLLFLTIAKINNIEERGIYTDLLRKFRDEGHEVFIMCPIERREGKSSNISALNGVTILQVKTLNLQKVNLIEKGLGTLLIEYQYLSALKKYFKDEHFDLVLYSTPPITFTNVVKFFKKRDNSYTYLLLKDIFPQNAVDMKMFSNGGIIHNFFTKKEKELYRISDTIGCMSDANKQYIIKNNIELEPNKIEVNPNSISPIRFNFTEKEKEDIKIKYNIPLDKTIFVYGGNLGKPQGIDFLLETIENCNNIKAFFLIVGSGTEYDRIYKRFQHKKLENALLLAGLPKNDYDVLLKACDVGMIFLHRNFTIPNFPSRLLSYLEMQLPIIAATDSVTDIGKVIEEAKCGKWVHSGDLLKMQETISEMCNNKKEEYKTKTLQLLENKYSIDISYQLINNKIKSV